MFAERISIVCNEVMMAHREYPLRCRRVVQQTGRHPEHCERHKSFDFDNAVPNWCLCAITETGREADLYNMYINKLELRPMMVCNEIVLMIIRSPTCTYSGRVDEIRRSDEQPAK